MDFFFLLKKDVSKQFIRFCIIGLESTILTYLIYIILMYFFKINYLFSSAVGFLIGAIFGFTFNKIYAFQSKRKSVIALPQYLAVYLFSMTFNLIALKFLVEIIKIGPLISNTLIIPFLTLINFFGTKIIVFKNKKW